MLYDGNNYDYEEYDEAPKTYVFLSESISISELLNFAYSDYLYEFTFMTDDITFSIPQIVLSETLQLNDWLGSKQQVQEWYD